MSLPEVDWPGEFQLHPTTDLGPSVLLGDYAE